MARVMLYNHSREYSDSDFEESRELGQKYLDMFMVEAVYGGFMIAEGVMKNTPFWIIDDNLINLTITAFREAIASSLVEGYAYQIFKKEDLNYRDHLDRETWSVAHRVAYDSN